MVEKENPRTIPEIEKRVLNRRAELEEKLLYLIHNPQELKKQRDVISLIRDDRYLGMFVSSSFNSNNDIKQEFAKDIFNENDKFLLFGYAKIFEEEATNSMLPIIRNRDLKEFECGILDLDSLDEDTRAIAEKSFNEMETILNQEEEDLKW